MTNLTFKADQLDQAQIVVGKKIRGYDFAPRPGCDDRFVEGVVQSVEMIDGVSVYVVMVDHDSCDWGEGADPRVGHLINVPLQVSFMDFDERVQLIEEEVVEVDFHKAAKSLAINYASWCKIIDTDTMQDDPVRAINAIEAILKAERDLGTLEMDQLLNHEFALDLIERLWERHNQIKAA